MDDVVQVASIAGAAMILLAFFLLQRGRWRRDGLAYLWCNIIGSSVLTAVGVWDQRLGFIALEGGWACVSAWSLATRSRTASSPS